MFPDLTKHSEYLRGQSLEWCNQLAGRTGKYEFTWSYNYEGQAAEHILSEKLYSLLHGKVLDVGCGGDGNGEGAECGLYFPGLFASPSLGTPTLDKIQERLEASGLIDIELSVLKETVWIPTAEEVFEMVCFGQSDGFRQFVRKECYNQIVSQFEKHTKDKRIKTTGFYYLIQAKAA